MISARPEACFGKTRPTHIDRKLPEIRVQNTRARHQDAITLVVSAYNRSVAAVSYCILETRGAAYW